MATTSINIAQASMRGLMTLLELYSQLEQLSEGRCEVFEEELLVPGVELHVLSEVRVLEQPQVGRQHHEITRRVLVLQGSGPGLPLVSALRGPLLLQQQSEVLVAEGRLCVGPRAPVPRGIQVAPA